MPLNFLLAEHNAAVRKHCFLIDTALSKLIFLLIILTKGADDNKRKKVDIDKKMLRPVVTNRNSPESLDAQKSVRPLVIKVDTLLLDKNL
jgi:hypothetical protein